MTAAKNASARPASARPAGGGWLRSANQAMGRIPDDLIALVARLSIAAVFWQSGQGKVRGLRIDLAEGRFDLGWPRVTGSTLAHFRDDYRLPVLPPELAANLFALAELALPVLLVLGLGTRLAALGLLLLTAVIHFVIHPHGAATHGVWAAVLLYLMAHGPGRLSLDSAFGWR